MTDGTPQLSVVIPAYNEQENIIPLYTKLREVLADVSFETIFINDGSRDNTLSILQKLADEHKNVSVVSFSRNFGKEMATTAGILQAKGKAIIMVDCDGQFPPELIPDFLAKWKEGYQVVTGVRMSNQKEGLVKRFGSKLFYRLMSSMAGAKITPRATDFRLIDRVVQEQFRTFTEHNRITRGLIDWVGFREAFIPFHANPRMAGEATYKVSQLIKLAMNSFVSLSLAPLYFSGYVGLIITPTALLLGLFVIVEQLIMNDPLGIDFTGTAMLGVLLLFFVGVLLISQGLVALYISHIHTETQNRPLYIIDPLNSRLK
ncbi:MAG TPA: glycosyltransferase family 2 protein [Candidatus Saccharimonadales bacterium]|nr:glycosyltransferase family 2 protein [Candidatus Saccharimonadales bacterium]